LGPQRERVRGPEQARARVPGTAAREPGPVPAVREPGPGTAMREPGPGAAVREPEPGPAMGELGPGTPALGQQPELELGQRRERGLRQPGASLQPGPVPPPGEPVREPARPGVGSPQLDRKGPVRVPAVNSWFQPASYPI
jgi:hypothetical protein